MYKLKKLKKNKLHHPVSQKLSILGHIFIGNFHLKSAKESRPAFLAFN